MSVKVAINGFGRIGRLAFRQMIGAEGFEVVDSYYIVTLSAEHLTECETADTTETVNCNFN